MQQSRSIGFGHSVIVGIGSDAVTYGHTTAHGWPGDRAGTSPEDDLDADRDNAGSGLAAAGPYDPDHARWRTEGGGGSGTPHDFEE